MECPFIIRPVPLRDSRRETREATYYNSFRTENLDPPSEACEAAFSVYVIDNARDE
jgi:hypothetical protein